MEQQVAQAALAMVLPTTTAAVRSQASQFLEGWTRTPDAWDIYIKWLRSFRDEVMNTMAVNSEQLGMQLLSSVQLMEVTVLRRRHCPFR